MVMTASRNARGEESKKISFKCDAIFEVVVMLPEGMDRLW